jgi:hypothetical protein
MILRVGQAGRRREAGADGESVKLTVRLPVSLVKAAKHYAIDAGIDVQEVVAQALAAFLARGRRRARHGED